jgi:predicted ferric reductase
MKMTLRGILFFFIYFFLASLPLAVALISAPNRSAGTFIVELAVGAGFIGFSLMALEFALISRIKPAAQAFGTDALQLFHNIMGVVALALLLVHPALLILSGYPANAWLNPFAANGNSATQTASLALYALVILVATSIWRKKFRLSYEWWQVLHGILSIFVLVAAMKHIFVLGRYTTTDVMRILWLVYTVLVISLIVWYKIIQPLSRWDKKWEVVENKPERGDAHTLVLKPIDHDGFSFEPGQYAWIKGGTSPLGYGQHPISISSSGDAKPGGEITFTIKELGDWSREEVPGIQPGSTMWVDGPYGVLSSDREQGMGYVLIAGGIGITPLHAMCMTMAQRGDVRPVLLLYGAPDWESITFQEQLDELKEKMNLKVIYVLQNPPEGWQGESGYIDTRIVKKYLPEHFKHYIYFVCGPPPLMDAMDIALPELGVPAEKVLSERFEMA